MTKKFFLKKNSFIHSILAPDEKCPFYPRAHMPVQDVWVLVRQMPGVLGLDGGECGAFGRFLSDSIEKKIGHQWKIDR